MSRTACYADFSGGIVLIGNDRIERRWRVERGTLVPLSLIDKTHGQEWLRPGAISPTSPAGTVRSSGPERFTASEAPLVYCGSDALHACLVIPVDGGEIVYKFVVVPGMAAVTQQVVAPPAESKIMQTSSVGEPTGIEVDPVNTSAGALESDVLEHWWLAPHHILLHRVSLADQTDRRDNLLQWEIERTGPVEALSYQGCLFALEDPLTRRGIILLKQAPLPHARPIRMADDLYVGTRECRLLGHGAGDTANGYPWTVLLFAGGRQGITQALQTFQQHQRAYNPELDGLAISNTWGDRHRDSALRESFLLQEIDVASEIGLDVCQIDDGWQRGVSFNSVDSEAKGGIWEGFYHADSGFWAINEERFPNGFSPLLDACRNRSLGFGLWFVPDSSNDFANWRRDVDTIVQLHRTHGVRWIKIDGVKARTRRGEENLKSFFDEVFTATAGAIQFDLDVTADIRPGYFGRPGIGSIFVENRYTDWRRWWPHATLRNLWQLSQVVHPRFLRMEWLNPERNAEKYEDDPLAPAHYDAAYIFATIMVSSPLFWCELSHLSPAVKRQLQSILPLWKQHRQTLHRGTIYPIGDCPDGASWTGFCSVAAGGESAHLLVFRECHPERQAFLPLPLADGLWQAETITSSGACRIDGTSAACVLDEMKQFGWWRLYRNLPGR